MKKVLLAGTALLGIVALTSTAQADIDLDLGGYFSGYGVFADNDEPAATPLRDFEFRRDSEFHITGETTTDHGLTVGVHGEAKVGNNTGFANNPNSGLRPLTDEIYVYFSGTWGRFNFGVEDGAAYLLQVEAPSADSNVDGLRTFVTGINTDLFNDGVLDGDFTGEAFDYQHADFRRAERLTYLTPKFSGFQAGISYAPDDAFNGPGALFGTTADNTGGAYENLLEASARWDGEFEGVGVSVGGGYSHASLEAAGAAVFANNGSRPVGSDDLTTWNAGLNVSFSGFTVGGVFHTTNNGSAATDEDTDTWTVGGAWDNGPYHVGVSYLDREYGAGSVLGTAIGNAVDLTRLTFGGGYTYGPGMSFRGAVAMFEYDTNGGGTDQDGVQATVGTQIDF